ncbi:MAG: SLBB domain-containing protein [Syntrophobacteraceae bacterium]|nr:SLBB domain-containing protein [Syntrophobacteraceae bacterium]
MPLDPKTISDRFQRMVAQARERVQAKSRTDVPLITIGMATCGLAAGAAETKVAFEESLKDRKVEARVVSVGCMGHCYAEPLVLIEKPGFPAIYYSQVTPGRARVLVKAFLEEDDPVYDYVYAARDENDLLPSLREFPRFSLESRVVMKRCGGIDPLDIDHYLVDGGYEGLVKALALGPHEIIRKVLASGLRGRGGAGFPTGLKWQLAGSFEGERKVVICNADEGDPGAYMDRTLIESNPHQTLEGLIICGVAVGADLGVVYLRSEYPLAVKTISEAIRQAEALGLVGTRILGTDFNLVVRVFRGSGAFVCGEETALIQSLEGKRGIPQYRPPYPVQSGLYGWPTVTNNVKTLASVPPILTGGEHRYRSIGIRNSPGTAIFSVVGNVVYPGLVEIPMGTTLRHLIFDICGGIAGKKRFKAVQVGGPSGGCLPESFLDTPVDFDSLVRTGAIMGSGGLVVMDEDSCMVDVARYFLEFIQKESCGKCTFCRIGTRHLLNALDRITRGQGTEEDLVLLETLSEDIREGALCGLGKTAPNPVITSLRYFREEYEAHVREKRCPARKCRAMTAFYIDQEKCSRGCEVCVGCCPVDAVFSTRDRKKAVDQSRCVKCGECAAVCPPEYGAVRKVSPPTLAPLVERPQT